MKPEAMMDPLHLFSLFLFMLIPAVASAQEATAETLDAERWSLSLEWLYYRSYSQQNNDMPMKARYTHYIEEL